MKEIGKTTSSQVMEKRPGLMEPAMRDNIFEVRNTEEEHLYGLTAQAILVNFIKAIFKEKESTTGKMEELTMANG